MLSSVKTEALDVQSDFQTANHWVRAFFEGCFTEVYVSRSGAHSVRLELPFWLILILKHTTSVNKVCFWPGACFILRFFETYRSHLSWMHLIKMENIVHSLPKSNWHNCSIFRAILFLHSLISPYFTLSLFETYDGLANCVSLVKHIVHNMYVASQTYCFLQY